MRTRFAFLIFLFATGLAVAFAPLSALPLAAQERTFRIDARQFAYSPSELQVNLGDRVTIELVSSDVVHGLYMEGYGISVEGDPGQSVALSFTADKAGSFRFRCNVTCGAMHPFMIGRLTVGSNQWLSRSIALAVLAVTGVLVLPKMKPD